MDMSRLLESVKKHEGYRNKVYLDTLGKRTVGVGHLCVEDFWEDDKEGGRHITIPSGWVQTITYLKGDYKEKENV